MFLLRPFLLGPCVKACAGPLSLTFPPSLALACPYDVSTETCPSAMDVSRLSNVEASAFGSLNKIHIPVTEFFPWQLF
jgi:hypothetical protein